MGRIRACRLEQPVGHAEGESDTRQCVGALALCANEIEHVGMVVGQDHEVRARPPARQRIHARGGGEELGKSDRSR